MRRNTTTKSSFLARPVKRTYAKVSEDEAKANGRNEPSGSIAARLILVVFARERTGANHSQSEENKPGYFQPENVQDSGNGKGSRFQAAEKRTTHAGLTGLAPEYLRNQSKLPNGRDTGQTCILAVSGNEIRG